MNEVVVGFIGIFVLLVLIFLGMPIGFAMTLVGFLWFFSIVGLDGALSNLSSIPYQYVADYTFIVIPLFLLMGSISANTGISKDLYSAADRWLGHLRGGLAMATVMAAAAFAAISGSSTATAAAMGNVAYPEMKRYRYDPRLATGCIAAGGTMGILIPPSLGFILYAILTEESIGQLFMAGIIPGILEALLYIMTIYILCFFNPKLGPAGPRTDLKTKLVSLKNTWAMLALFILVMGGIYLGIFTPTEAAAIGASGALVVSLIAGKVSRSSISNSLQETGRATAMIFLMVIGAFTFMRFLAVSNIPFVLADFVTNLNAPAYGVLAIIIIFYIFVGCFLDIPSTMVLTMPIVYPTIVALGFNPIWFGVLFVRVGEIGEITPPIGMNCYILSGVTGVPVGTVFRGILPFFMADIVHVLLIIIFPAIALFLPQMMMR